jgi:hypothetical protein
MQVKKSSDAEFSLFELAVLLPQVEQFLSCAFHLELEFLELGHVHLGAGFLD